MLSLAASYSSCQEFLQSFPDRVQMENGKSKIVNLKAAFQKGLKKYIKELVN